MPAALLNDSGINLLEYLPMSERPKPPQDPPPMVSQSWLLLMNRLAGR